MDAVDRLIASNAVERTKAEYFRAVDAKDWPALVALFAPDAVTDFRQSVEPHNPDLLLSNPQAFAQGTAQVLDGVKTAHFGYNPRIDFAGPDSASAVWAMEDWLWIPTGHPVLPAGVMHGWGHYHDEYRREGERWLIASTRLTRIHLDHRS